MEDIERFKSNCKHFARKKGSREVLSLANGSTHYKTIAKDLGMHHTTVSGILKEAEKLELATKTPSGFYKKKSGVMQYIPSSKKGGVPSTIQADQVVKKIKKKTSSNSKAESVVTQVTLPPRIANISDKMSEAYQWLYFTENMLRELVRTVFQAEEGWWQKRVPPDIQTSVQNEISNTSYDAAKRTDELEYTHLGQLKTIILKNWEFFRAHLHEKDRPKFGATIDRAIPFRNAVSHSIPLKKEDQKNVEVRFGDILKMLK